jgi:3',5'-cyclic AMP phosphodiesterase CpdA
MKFLHLSDLHIHSHASDNVETAALLHFVAEHYPDHRLIVTGDITDDGAPKQYENAFTLLQPFVNKIYIAPGNHDFGAAGNFYSRERAQRFDAMLTRPLAQGGTFTGDSTPVVNMIEEDGLKIMMIALDSNLETIHPFDFACGEIGESQLAALNTILNASLGTAFVNVLFFHHHPFMVNDPFMELKDAAALARTVYGKVNLILFGHKHVMDAWDGRWGTHCMLASDNSPGKQYAKEISIDRNGIVVSPVPVSA